ncbi:MAG: M48 family metalloprotease [bacterium]|nr:M48 family metalloprotease [bacterium]
MKAQFACAIVFGIMIMLAPRASATHSETRKAPPPIPQEDSAVFFERTRSAALPQSVGADTALGAMHTDELLASGDFMLSQDAEAEHYLNALLRQVLAVMPLGAFVSGDFRLYLGRTRSKNPRETPAAWSFPGGAIFVEEGFFAAADDEAALVHLLAHEAAHSILRHQMRRIEFLRQPEIAPIIAWRQAVRSCAPADDACNAAFGKLAELQAGLRELQEQETDIMAMETSIAMGYRPQATMAFFKKLYPEKLRHTAAWLVRQRIDPNKGYAFHLMDAAAYRRLHLRYADTYAAPPMPNPFLRK